MKNKIYFPLYIHLTIYILAAFSFAYYLDMSMPDDGLRHLAFSANKDIMNSWGEVFPFSLFDSYDPWFLWHKTIALILSFISFEHVHIFINSVVLFLLMLIIDIYVRNEIKFNFASISYIVVFSIVFFTSFRYLMIRPDLLSGLFVMYALVLKNRYLPIFVLTILYGPFYYLFFIYTGSIGLVFLIQKKWKLFFGVFSGSLFALFFHLLYDLNGFIKTVKNILIDQKLRMGLEVGEGRPIFDFLGNLNYFVLLPLFLGLAIYLVYKYNNYFKNNSLALFLLISSILWMNQSRYFALFFPLIVIFIISAIMNSNKRVILKKLRQLKIFVLKNSLYAKKSIIFYVIAIPYAIFALSYSFSTKSMNKDILEASFFKNDMFKNKTVLLNNLHTDIYKALYHNPTIKFVPSCSIGWFEDKDSKMKDIYVRMQKENGITENELFTLIEYIDADFYIHYLRNKKQILDLDKLKNLGILPEIIFHNRIIFRIDKEKL